MTKIDVEKMLSHQAETFAKLADTQAHACIGEHVMQLIEAGQTVSLDALRVAVQRTIDTSPSTRGSGKPEFDVLQLKALAALKLLSAIP
ncbi:MAG: hypothetical protein ACTS5I_13435 [Rhodanobacter sp.]